MSQTPNLKTKASIVQYARNLLNQNCLFLDIKTNSFADDAQIVEIAVLRDTFGLLLNTLVKPNTPILRDAIAFHGITDKTVINAPTFWEIYQSLVQILDNDKIILTCNPYFDTRVIKYCCELYNLHCFKFKDRTICLMDLYAEWDGDYFRYRTTSLGGVPALQNCQFSLETLIGIAASSHFLNN